MTTAYNNKKLIQSGFTLIELLIVISVIGILSGIAISVIDPIKQQNKSRDSVTVATLNKMGLATNSYMSAYGVAPMGPEFIAGIANYDSSLPCADNVVACYFKLTGFSLPSNCLNTDPYYGSGSTQCVFMYRRLWDTTSFVIYAKSYSSDNLFKYDSTTGKVSRCTNIGHNDASMICTPL